MKKLLLSISLSFLLFNHSTIIVNANENPKEEILEIVKKFMPVNASLVSPEKLISTQSIQLYDFNHDGQKEIIFTFEIEAIEQPAPSQYRVIVLEKYDRKWHKVLETKIRGVGLDFSGLADLTGDGTKEYLFGVTIGAAIGSTLEVFQWNDDTFKKIAELTYNHMDLVNENEQVGVATWQMYIGDSYIVDVVKWDGEKLGYDRELYAKYYPVIEKYYEKKIVEMDAWFYWYSLADAQIKAHQLEKASFSIRKGLSLAKTLSMPEVVRNFMELND